ncbi:TonB-dependent receptor [Paludibaculum fermentans]|uniref:TonB-dependent receptor n=1 Tax=Paludibaculum fermentans TaxID=1473598 RepID=UPI003EBDD665
MDQAHRLYRGFMRGRRRRAVISLVFPSVLFAQSGDISGVVRSQGGLGIARAKVSATCTPETAETDELGAFSLSGVSQGCRLAVAAEGFETAMYTVNGLSQRIEVVIAIDRLRQTVTVLASSPLVNSNPELSTTIDTRTLSQVPSSTRDINRFAMLDPRVRNTSSLGTDGVYGTRLAANSQLFRFTQYQMDGLSNYEPALGNGPQQVLSIASVAEYKVLVHQYGAEYGRSSAGIISAITRTGGEDWHGEVFSFLRPSGIQAAPPLSLFRVPNERFMWGGAAGGPISRSWHAFASLEGNQQTRGAFIQSPVPSFYPGHQTQYFGLVNLDWRQDERLSFYLRLNGHSTVGDNPNDAVGGFVQASAARRDSGQNVGFQVTHRRLVSRSVLNELRMGAAKSVPQSYYALHPQTQVVRQSYSTEGLSDYFDQRVITWQVSERVLWQRGSHSLQVGGDFIRNKMRDVSTSLYGSYVMSAGPPHIGEIPLRYTQTFGAAPVRYGDTLASWFVQDDLKLVPRLTLNLGVRHEYQSTTHDSNNVAPRLGFAWDVFGGGRTVFRGGAGVYYDQVFLQVVRGALQQGPDSLQATYTLPYGVTGFPVFPNSLTAPPTGAGDRRDLALYSPHRLNPYSGQFTFGVQRVLGEEWTLSANVSHMLSRKQLRTLDLNAPSLFVRTGPGQLQSAMDADATRPYEAYGRVSVRAVSLAENTGSSRYSAFDVQIAKRFTRRFQLMAHYLYSSSITYVFFTGGPNTGVPSDWGNRGIDERGPSDFHQRHRMTAQGIVDLPMSLQFTFYSIAASGLPVNPLTGVDNNGDSNLLDRPVGFGRNSFRAPSQSTMDLSLTKKLNITQQVRAELRLEGTNLINRSNILRVNAIYGDRLIASPTFLQPIAGLANTDPGRQWQVGLRITY